VAITFLSNDDEEVMYVFSLLTIFDCLDHEVDKINLFSRYELKQEISKSPLSKVPAELAKHDAAQQKVTRDMKRKRDGDDQG